jgi:hypothetical protein
VLLADAPPHGVCPSDDVFPDGGPEGAVVDLLQQADRLADLNARLMMVLCGRHGAGYNGFTGMNEVFQAICTRACPYNDPVMIPLDAGRDAVAMLTQLVTGAAAELDAEDAFLAVADQVEAEVRASAASPAAMAAACAAPMTDAEVDARVTATMAARGITLTPVQHDGVVTVEAPAAAVFSSAPSLKAARAELSAKGLLLAVPPPPRSSRISRMAGGDDGCAALHVTSASAVLTSSRHASADDYARLKSKRSSARTPSHTADGC